VQMSEGSTGRLQLEILLFPAADSYPQELLSEVVVDVLDPNSCSCEVGGRTSRGRDSPNKDLEVISNFEDGDGLDGLTNDWFEDWVAVESKTADKKHGSANLDLVELTKKLAVLHTV
jgi:hypothetical protein